MGGGEAVSSCSREVFWGYQEREYQWRRSLREKKGESSW